MFYFIIKKNVIFKGIYKGTNCSLETSKFNLLPVDCSYWKIKFMLTDVVLKKILTCSIFEGSIC